MATQFPSRHERMIEWLLAVLFVALFVYGVSGWLGWTEVFQPGRFVLLAGAATLVSIASTVQHRSRRAFYFLAATATVAAIATFFVSV